MYQIDNPSAAGTQPASTPAGTAGFFTDGNPAGGVPATIVPAEWLNAVQMELINAVIASGQTPSKVLFNQLAKAVTYLTSGNNQAGFLKLPNGFIMQWGFSNLPGSSTSVTVTLPTTFPNIVFRSYACDTGSTTWPVGVSNANNSSITLFVSPFSVNTGSLAAKSANAVISWLVIGN